MRQPLPLPASDTARSFAESKGIALGEDGGDIPVLEDDAEDLTNPSSQFSASADSGCVAGCGGGCESLS
jgi:hypothetical protein